ncbi:hypothetical protein KTF56_29360 [Burkholderia gladioli]|uniref:hypothetical protein n=1 Tax=Burkholderia gladioli TaxID=28095 RepID=UPI001C218773|nr:hypothetical protein [Burkholderia gladioli]MBU9687006.1 hypothetical protein [Burkholderia gladioli]
MPLTTYDLIDDAIKIGLGALIGAVGTISAALLKNRHDIAASRNSADNEREKERRTNRRRLIEAALTGVEPFIRRHRQLLLATHNSVARSERAIKSGTPLTKAQISSERKNLIEIGGMKTVYAEHYYSAHSHVGSLSLAAASHESKLLSGLLSVATKQRDAILAAGTSGKLPTVDDIKLAIKEFSEIRVKFLGALGELYDAL